jgi:hypothetical protein
MTSIGSTLSSMQTTTLEVWNLFLVIKFNNCSKGNLLSTIIVPCFFPSTCNQKRTGPQKPNSPKRTAGRTLDRSTPYSPTHIHWYSPRPQTITSLSADPSAIWQTHRDIARPSTHLSQSPFTETHHKNSCISFTTCTCFESSSSFLQHKNNKSDRFGNSRLLSTSSIFLQHEPS